MISPIQEQLDTNAKFQKYMGIGLFLSGTATIPASILVVRKTIFFFLGFALIIGGLYDLYTSRFYAVIKPGASITLGIGIQLIVLNVLEVWELLFLWPLSFILFGTITILGGIVEDRYYRTARS